VVQGSQCGGAQAKFRTVGESNCTENAAGFRQAWGISEPEAPKFWKYSGERAPSYSRNLLEDVNSFTPVFSKGTDAFGSFRSSD
jgi:hypothetical protein